ncbi:hypothetical protein [Sodalis sp. dw_96]|uniref:hypothetical protein n=1 Tax=Sodalis sp. dw_96 TaxID=2719794 RepID=UPI0021048235|nr:hypothetical protein [Sodalis sp. dw_96]
MQADFTLAAADGINGLVGRKDTDIFIRDMFSSQDNKGLLFGELIETLADSQGGLERDVVDAESRQGKPAFDDFGHHLVFGQAVHPQVEKFDTVSGRAQLRRH